MCIELIAMQEGEEGEESEDGEDGEEGDEGEEEEEGQDDAGHSAILGTGTGRRPPPRNASAPKAKSEETTPVSAFKTPALPSRAPSEPPSLPAGLPAKPAAPAGENTPAKPFGAGIGRPGSAFGGTPARSSPLASNPPLTANQESESTVKAPAPKPAIDLSLPPKPAFTPFPGFAPPASTPGRQSTPPAASPAPPTLSTPIPATTGIATAKLPFSLGAQQPSSPVAPASPASPSARGASASPVSPVQVPAVPGETPLQQHFAEVYMRMSQDISSVRGIVRCAFHY